MPSIGKRSRRKDFLPLIESDVPILKQAKAEYAKRNHESRNSDR